MSDAMDTPLYIRVCVLLSAHRNVYYYSCRSCYNYRLRPSSACRNGKQVNTPPQGYSVRGETSQRFPEMFTCVGRQTWFHTAGCHSNAHRGCANEDVIGDAICRQLPENADDEIDAVCRLRRATFERRKVSATLEHVGARASPSYARERNASTRRLSARAEEASATHAPVNRMR